MNTRLCAATNPQKSISSLLVSFNANLRHFSKHKSFTVPHVSFLCHMKSQLLSELIQSPICKSAPNVGSDLNKFIQSCKMQRIQVNTELLPFWTITLFTFFTKTKFKYPRQPDLIKFLQGQQMLHACREFDWQCKIIRGVFVGYFANVIIRWFC